ncbi:MAG: TonB-dependent receptor [Myxococcota bacterium]
MMPWLGSSVAIVAMLSNTAYARDTGSIQGTVRDENRSPLEDAVVVLSGAELGGEITARTDERGRYRFDNVAPGEYDLRALFEELEVARARVRVALQTTTSANLQGSLDIPEMLVTFKPVVDRTQTAFSTVLNEEAIQNLPVGRTYQDVIQTVPGIQGRVDTQNGGAGAGNFSARGEGQYGNNFIVEGFSTRDPSIGTFGLNLNFDAIEEVQVFTDGAPAEFGEFTGSVSNIVIKDGGDEHHGSAAFFYSQHAWLDSQYPILDPDVGIEIPTLKSRFRNVTFNGTAGGPLIREKLWYFTALDLFSRWNVPEGVDYDPDDPNGAQPITSQGGRFLGKLSWFPNRHWKVSNLFLANATPQNNWDASQFVTPEATTDRLDWGITDILNATWNPNPLDTLELRMGYQTSNIDVVPNTADATIPSVLDELGTLRYNSENASFNDRSRASFGFVFQRLLPNFLGRHKIRTGATYNILRASRRLEQTGETTIDFIDSDGNVSDLQVDVGTRYAPGVDENGTPFPCREPDGSDCGIREHWLNVGNVGTLVYTAGLFLQDEWQPAPNLTLNLGVRMDFEDGRNNDGSRAITEDPFEFALDEELRSPQGQLSMRQMFAPRLGVSWDPFNDTKTKVTAHYGRYFDVGNSQLYSWANTITENGFVRFARTNLDDPFSWSNTQDPAGNPLIYANDLTPGRLDKFNVGIEREVVKDLAIGVRGIWSETGNLPEDVNADLAHFYILNSPLKKRRYRALEVTVNKIFDGKWQLYGAYTFQSAQGTSPGQFELEQGGASGSNGNNVGVFLDDTGDLDFREFLHSIGRSDLISGFRGLGRYDVDNPAVADDAGWFGYLPYHSFHAIKLNGSYTTNFGMTLSAVYEFDSGRAWQKKGFVPFYGFEAFPQGRGTRFMPAAHWLDLRIAQRFDLGPNGQSIEATLDIFNVPGLQAPTDYFQNNAQGFGRVLFRQAPRSIRLGLKARY